MAQMVLPVLKAEAEGEKRWCAWCSKLTPDKDIDLCSQCHQVGYCRPLNKMQLRRMPYEEQERRRATNCQHLHWKAGHKHVCKSWAAEAAERKAREEEEKARAEEEKAREGEGAAGGGGSSGAAGGGRGGGGREGGKKKGKKKRGNRR